MVQRDTRALCFQRAGSAKHGVNQRTDVPFGCLQIPAFITRLRDPHSQLIHRAREQVSESLGIVGRELSFLVELLNRAPQQSESVFTIYLTPAGPAEDARRVFDNDPPQFRIGTGIEERQRSGVELIFGSFMTPCGGLNTACYLTLASDERRLKQSQLATEVVVQRTAGDSRGFHDRFRSNSVEAVPAEQRSPDLNEGPGGFLSLFDLAVCPRHVDNHTECMYVNQHTECMYVIKTTSGSYKMQLSSFYPVIGTTDVAATANFYQQYFGFEPTFDVDWYVSLKSSTKPVFELGIVDCNHPSVPPGYANPVRGLILNFEVDDVDAEYKRLVAAGLAMVLQLKDEEWGQRHFITRDPNGVLIDVIRPTEPSAEFQGNYA